MYLNDLLENNNNQKEMMDYFMNPILKISTMNNNQNGMMMINAQNMQDMNQSMMEQLKKQAKMMKELMRKNSNEITIIFRVPFFYGLQNNLISIQCDLSEKVSDVILRFRIKSGLLNSYGEKFIYNAKNLNNNLTIEENGLTNNCMIFVIKTLGIASGK